jgi:predicted transcriptional regulator
VHIVLVVHMSTREAIADFVDRELEIVEGIQRGLEDMKADRVTPHKSAMRRLRAPSRGRAKASRERCRLGGRRSGTIPGAL